MFEVIVDRDQFIKNCMELLKKDEEEAKSKRHVIHIRKTPPRKGGNQWYKDRSITPGETLCGCECGLYDVPLKETKYKSFDIKDPFWKTKGEFCPECFKLANLKER